VKIAFIPPVRHINLVELGDYAFILAQQAQKHPEIIEYYKQYTGFKILDNGAFEAVALKELPQCLPFDVCMDLAKEMTVDEVVLPDYPYEGKKTFEENKELLESISLKEKRMFRLMHVPHGRSVLEYVDWYMAALELDVDTIGFSILDLWKQPGMERMRPFVVHYLRVNHLLPPKFEYHLLGLDMPFELQCYSKVTIRSVDTSMPFTLAAYDQFVTPIVKKYPRPADHIITSKEWRLIFYNCRRLQRVAHGGVDPWRESMII